jgi:large subunit ribosomal protein L21
LTFVGLWGKYAFLFLEVDMYAIIETGGKQYRVEEGSKVVVEKLAVQAGSEISLDKVLMVGGAECKVGAPYLAGAAVMAEVVDHGRGPKIKVFKRWRRNDSRKLRGHRQDYTTIRVKSINA